VNTGTPQTRTTGHRPPVSAMRLILTVGGWVVGLFGLLRLDWIQQRVLLPLGAAQQQIAGDLMGASTTAVVVDVSCTGADEMALCVGVIMAFPAGLSARVRGALGGLALVLVLNTVRIGSLSLVADDRAMLDLLHLYVWPAMLVVAVLAYVFVWMTRVTGKGTDATGGPTTGAHGSPALPTAMVWRFLTLAGLGVAIYFAVAPWIYQSVALSALAGAVATVGAFIITGLGVPATASGNFLTTAHGGFIVTQECIATPLIPVYIASVLTAPLSVGRRALALALAPPLFFSLGIARLLVLALPQALVASHVAAIHAFSQVLTALVVVIAAAWVRGRTGRPRSWATGAPVAIAVATVLGFAIGPLWTDGVRVVAGALQHWSQHSGHTYADPQAAMAFLPAFQVALFLALWLAASGTASSRTLVIGLVALATTQVTIFILLGELGQHVGFAPHVSLIRALALGLPIVLMMVFEGWLAHPAGSTADTAPPPTSRRPSLPETYA
jgi:exosortase/archaeosortase family protein